MIVVSRSSREFVRFRSVAIDDQVFEPKQTTASRTNQIQVSVAVEISHLGIQAKTNLTTRINQRALPTLRLAMESIRINDQRVVFARILAIVPHVSLAG